MMQNKIVLHFFCWSV